MTTNCFVSRIVDFCPGGDRLTSPSGNQNSAIVQQRRGVRHAGFMHRWQRFECSRRGVIQLRRRQPLATIRFVSTCDKHVAVAKQRHARMGALRRHLPDHDKFLRRRIVFLDRVGDSRAQSNRRESEPCSTRHTRARLVKISFLRKEQSGTGLAKFRICTCKNNHSSRQEVFEHHFLKPVATPPRAQHEQSTCPQCD